MGTLKQTLALEWWGGITVMWMMGWWRGVLIGWVILCCVGGTIDFSFASQSSISRSQAQAKSKAKPRQDVRAQKSRERQSVAKKKVTPRKKDRHVVSSSQKKQKRRSRLQRITPKRPVQVTESEPLGDFSALLLADAETGQLLRAEHIDRQWPTASLTKMMVGLLAMKDIERGRLSFTTPVVISQRASRAGGRTIGLRPGEVFSFGELLRAMLVTSANDAAVAVAERMKGSVGGCVAAMNQMARTLGMRKTKYQTVNGMPVPGGGGDISSARDMAILGIELLKYRRIVDWTSLDHAPFRDGRVTLPNTNRLVGKVYGVNGLKTGFTARARYNLVATAQRQDRALIVVVLGGKNSHVRFATAEESLEWGFSRYARVSARDRNDLSKDSSRTFRSTATVLRTSW
ncbi:MAG: D-alanyl-D-alanine carboxypeptidase family protein [Candidatus Binatia bacterium]